MKNIDRKELASLRKEVNDEIREIKASIKDEEKRDEFSRKVDRLYDRLEGNELLLGAVDMVLSELKNKNLRDDQLQNIIEEFKDAVDFSERNGASFSSRDILDRVLVSNTNESFKSRRKIIKESRVSDSYSSRWEEVLELALEQLESEHYGHMNGSGEMYFELRGRYGEEIPYEGFASFDSVNADNNLIMHVVYPESVSVSSSVERILDNPEEPEIYINDIKSEAEKEKALDQMDDYIDALKSDLKAIDDWRDSDELTEIAEAMSEHGRVEELEIELPDEDWIDFDEFDSEEEAILNAMKDAIVSELVSYSESVSRDADDVFSDASYEIEKLSDELSEFLGDARDKRRDIEQLDFDDFESFKHRHTHHSVENKQIRFKKEAKGKFIRTINPTPTGREKTVTLHDLDVNPKVEYIGLFVNGNDIGGLDGVSWTKPMWDQLEPLMKKLDDELLKIKGEPNKKIEADIYLCDEDDNNEVTVEIPTIETDRFGHIVFDDSKGYPRKVKTLEDLCLIAFHKMLKNM